MSKRCCLILFAVLSSLAISEAQAQTGSVSDVLPGEPVCDSSGKLLYVSENSGLSRDRNEYVMVHVRKIKEKSHDEVGRVVVAVWDSIETYAKDGVHPFRETFYWAKEAVNHELVFKIDGLTRGEKYAFFSFFDQDNDGTLTRRFGIPVEQYVFSNAKNQGKGKGLFREGIREPKYEHTLVTYTQPGQQILLEY